MAFTITIGRATIKVRTPLRAAVFSTGDEVRDPGEDLDREQEQHPDDGSEEQDSGSLGGHGFFSCRSARV